MTRVFLYFVLVALLMCTSSTLALKILGISTVPSHSHHLWFTKFMNGLARKGHQVYAVGLEQTEFDVDEVMENQTRSFAFESTLDGSQNTQSCDPLEWSKMNPIEFGWFLYKECHEFCKGQMATEGAKQVLELVKNTKFDVIVQDLMIGQCFYGLWEIAQGNPPLVGYTPFGQPIWVKNIVGGNDWPAIRPYPFYSHTAPFSLWEKTVNVIYTEIDNILRQYYYMPIQQELAEKFIGRKMSRSLAEIEKQFSVMLINSHAALEPATFLPPNAIEVGGLHVGDPKPLPQDIQAFLDGAEHGVVVISLGTNIKTGILGLDRLNAIVTALGKLRQRVLWKFDLDHLADKPENVMIKKWIPQGDVLDENLTLRLLIAIEVSSHSNFMPNIYKLMMPRIAVGSTNFETPCFCHTAHPKVRVIWTHSGLLSTQEAVWRGVPLIGMPFFMDQNSNIDLLVKKGVALRLDFQFLTTEMISETIDRILTNPSFDHRMKQLALEYRDRPMSPMDLAIWHVEYASRHPRGPLASPGRDLSRVQLNLLDVYAVLGVALLSIFWIFRFLMRSLLNLFRTQQKTKTA